MNMNDVKIDVKSLIVVIVTALTILILLIRLISPAKFPWFYILIPFAIHLGMIGFQLILAYAAILFRLMKDLITKIQDRMNY